MANQTITKRSGRPGWLLALLALVMLVLAVWWFWPGDTPGEPGTSTPVLQEEAPLTAAPETDGVPVLMIVRDPGAWVGRSLQGPIEVLETVGPNVAWIGQGGEEMLAVWEGTMPQVQPRQVLDVQNATVVSTQEMPAGELGPDVRELLQDQQVYLRIAP
jgi:hypothetical protein